MLGELLGVNLFQECLFISGVEISMIINSKMHISGLLVVDVDATSDRQNDK